jgi:hypothetical protein
MAREASTKLGDGFVRAAEGTDSPAVSPESPLQSKLKIQVEITEKFSVFGTMQSQKRTIEELKHDGLIFLTQAIQPFRLTAMMARRLIHKPGNSCLTEVFIE